MGTFILLTSKLSCTSFAPVSIGYTVTYSIACSSAGAQDSNYTISGTTLQTNAAIDFELGATQTVCVRVTDLASGTYDENFTITINNVGDTGGSTEKSYIKTSCYPPKDTVAVDESITFESSVTKAKGDVIYAWEGGSGTGSTNSSTYTTSFDSTGRHQVKVGIRDDFQSRKNYCYVDVVSSDSTSQNSAVSTETTGSVDITPATTTATTTPVFGGNFLRNMYIGDTGFDVQVLQETLNLAGYTVSVTGFGSRGNETTYYGALTQQAVLRLQQHFNLTPSLGQLGPLTREYAELLKYFVDWGLFE